jgi:hypothetical protein
LSSKGTASFLVLLEDSVPDLARFAVDQRAFLINGGTVASAYAWDTSRWEDFRKSKRIGK